MVDHDTGRLVWAAKGRDSKTLRRFFDALGEQRSALLTHISADGAEWIHTVATERAPQALLCLDASHVVAWANAALDAARRGTWNHLPRDGKTDQAKALKNSRWALLKNPPDLTGDQPTTGTTIAKTNLPLYLRVTVGQGPIAATCGLAVAPSARPGAIRQATCGPREEP